MKLIGLMLARNEDWIIDASIDAALAWVDELVVLNHSSTDGTRTIASRYANEIRRVWVHDWDDGEHWMEMDARQRTLEIARSLGATHIAIIDADEILTHHFVDKVRGWFEGLKPGECLDVPMIAPWKSLDVYSPHTKAALTLGFRDDPALCWKPRGAEQYQHHHRPPHGTVEHIRPHLLEFGGVLHLQYAAWRRFVAKHRWYMMSERVRWPEKSVASLNETYHWWERNPHGMELAAIPQNWWGSWKRDRIHLDRPSWHEAECERLAAKYGAATFDGLDLFGWKP